MYGFFVMNQILMQEGSEKKDTKKQNLKVMFKNFPKVIQVSDLRNNTNDKKKSIPCQMIVKLTEN